MAETQFHLDGFDALDARCRGGVVTVGNFDGVHMGHREIITQARRQASALNGPVVAVTFDPPPGLILHPEVPHQRVSPHWQTVERLHEAGCDFVATLPATQELLALTAEEFIQQIVIQHFAPVCMVEGPDFRYGADRSGTVSTLADHGFVVVVVPEYLTPEGDRVSSSLIRSLVSTGHIAEVNDLLTRPFSLSGRVIPGIQAGRSLGFPTANLHVTEQVLPADGIYAGYAIIDGTRHPAAITLGVAPTFAEHPYAIEAHLLDVTDNFYDKPMTLEFVQHIRPQQQFESTDVLVTQIQRDIQTIRTILSKS
jgi:riboflavin kinase/FMN adenylyltransferase